MKKEFSFLFLKQNEHTKHKCAHVSREKKKKYLEMKWSVNASHDIKCKWKSYERQMRCAVPCIRYVCTISVWSDNPIELKNLRSTTKPINTQTHQVYMCRVDTRTSTTESFCFYSELLYFQLVEFAARHTMIITFKFLHTMLCVGVDFIWSCYLRHLCHRHCHCHCYGCSIFFISRIQTTLASCSNRKSELSKMVYILIYAKVSNNKRILSKQQDNLQYYEFRCFFLPFRFFTIISSFSMWMHCFSPLFFVDCFLFKH